MRTEAIPGSGESGSKGRISRDGKSRTRSARGSQKAASSQKRSASRLPAVITRTGACSARCSAAARNGRAGVTAPRTVSRAGPFLRVSAISRRRCGYSVMQSGWYQVSVSRFQ